MTTTTTDRLDRALKNEADAIDRGEDAKQQADEAGKLTPPAPLDNDKLDGMLDQAAESIADCLFVMEQEAVELMASDPDKACEAFSRKGKAGYLFNSALRKPYMYAWGVTELPNYSTRHKIGVDDFAKALSSFTRPLVDKYLDVTIPQIKAGNVDKLADKAAIHTWARQSMREIRNQLVVTHGVQVSYVDTQNKRVNGGACLGFLAQTVGNTVKYMRVSTADKTKPKAYMFETYGKIFNMCGEGCFLKTSQELPSDIRNYLDTVKHQITSQRYQELETLLSTQPGVIAMDESRFQAMAEADMATFDRLFSRKIVRNHLLSFTLYI